MKRAFQEYSSEHGDTLNMANCLLFLSQKKMNFDAVNGVNMASSVTASRRVFECKTCNKQFSSFQALGGHRASHKKPKLTEDNYGGGQSSTMMKPKTHECSVCGLEFKIGQALGGHMRRHRASEEPTVRKDNSRRAMFLDLNLTPYENDLEFYRLGRNNKTTEMLIDLKKPETHWLICS